MRIVVDTNVWISYYRFGGEVADQLDALLVSKPVTLFSSPLILDEFRRVMTQKFKFAAEAFGEVLSLLEANVEIATPTGPAPTVCRDPTDNHVLHLCQYVQADLLLTGDHDLLVLSPFGTTRIVQPTYLATLT